MTIGRAEQFIQAGIVAARTGDLSRARAMLRKAIALDPANADAWVWLAGVAEKPEDAVDGLERALQLDPKNLKAPKALKVARFEAGVAAANAKRRDDARRWLGLACADDPTNEHPWLWLASVTDDPSEVIKCLERALQINPANHQARAGIERLRVDRRAAQRWGCPICLAEADSHFTTCPKCHSVLDLAQGDAAIGNPSPDVARIQAGIARLSDAVRSDPSFVNRYYLGMALLNLGKPDQAIVQFRAARKLRTADTGFAAQVDLLERALAESASPTQRIVVTADDVLSKSQKSILVVDESATLRKLVGMTLRKNGYSVVEAQDGREALELIEAGAHPDLVLTDVNSPHLDGHALCRAIRQRPSTAKLPVVLMTPDEGFVSRMRDRSAGADQHLAKPFHPTALTKAVGELCPLDLAGKRGER